MNRPVLMCKKGKAPFQCRINCSECFSHDVIYIDFCDRCGVELDDEEINLCKKCAAEMKGGEKTWESLY